MEKNCSWSHTYGTTMCNLTIPNGASAWYLVGPDNYGGQAMVLTQPSKPLIYSNITLPPPKSVPSILVTQLIMAIGLDPNQGAAMFAAVTNKTQYIATECSLELYVRRVNTSVQNSAYQETTLETWSEIEYNQVYAPGAPEGIYYSFVVPNNLTTGASNGSQFYIGYNAHSSMQSRLLSLFNGTVSGFSDSLTFGTANTVTSDILQTLYVQNFTNCATPADKLSCVMGNIASSISKTFRDSAVTNAQAGGFNASANDVHNAANMTLGQTMVSETFLRVRWQWLSVPVLVWVLTALTWTTTTVHTSRARLPSWRNQILPLLFLYREDRPTRNNTTTYDAGRSAADESSSSAYNLKASNLQVRLFMQQHEARLL
jgi:hypothetical protein